MDLSKILTVSGKPGLYKIVSQAKDRVIIESVDETKKRIPVYASDKVSSLEEISIYTHEDSISLKDVLQKIYKKQEGKEAISHKSSADEMKGFFEEIIPDYDKERVYVSDIKKVLQWYNVFVENNMIDVEEEKPEEKSESKPEDEIEGKFEDKQEQKIVAKAKVDTLVKTKPKYETKSTGKPGGRSGSKIKNASVKKK